MSRAVFFFLPSRWRTGILNLARVIPSFLTQTTPQWAKKKISKWIFIYGPNPSILNRHCPLTRQAVLSQALYCLAEAFWNIFLTGPWVISYQEPPKRGTHSMWLWGHNNESNYRKESCHNLTHTPARWWILTCLSRASNCKSRHLELLTLNEMCP